MKRHSTNMPFSPWSSPSPGLCGRCVDLCYLHERYRVSTTILTVLLRSGLSVHQKEIVYEVSVFVLLCLCCTVVDPKRKGVSTHWLQSGHSSLQYSYKIERTILTTWPLNWLEAPPPWRCNILSQPHPHLSGHILSKCCVLLVSCTLWTDWWKVSWVKGGFNRNRGNPSGSVFVHVCVACEHDAGMSGQRSFSNTN